jgi:hypothetical protein
MKNEEPNNNQPSLLDRLTPEVAKFEPQLHRLGRMLEDTLTHPVGMILVNQDTRLMPAFLAVEEIQKAMVEYLKGLDYKRNEAGEWVRKE